MLCERGARPRIAMRGTSMLPLLREPMVLQLDRLTGAPKFGDVLLFSDRERLVAHRFIMRRNDGTLVLAGDAVRFAYEVVPRDRIIGVVRAVWSGPQDGATRVDGRAFVARGVLAACRSALRVHFAGRLRATANALAQANPRRRQRVYLALFNALAAIVQCDANALRTHVASVDPERLLAVAKRHRCGPILIDGLDALGAVDALPEAGIAALRKERWATAIRCNNLARQIDEVVRICGRAGVVPILLKGAARVFTDEPESRRHRSDDLDVLLPREAIDAATAALNCSGYRAEPYRLRVWNYRRAHHTPPLFNPVAGVPIELHYALATRGEMRASSDVQSLAGHIRYLPGPGGTVGLLDCYASALHSAIHGREPTPLRNVFVLAQQLRRLSSDERAALFAFAGREALEKNRIQSVLHAACRIAGLRSFAGADGRRHFAWRLRRYDLPFALSWRTAAIDWFVATSGRGVKQILYHFLPHENDEERAVPQPVRGVRYAGSVAAKPVVFAVVAAYAALMPPCRGERALAGLGEQSARGEIG